MKNNNIILSKYFMDIIKSIESAYKHIFLLSTLCILILLSNLNQGEFKTIYLLFIFEIVSLSLSKYAIHYFEFNGVARYNYIINSALILGVHLCVGLSVLGVYIAQLSF